MSDMERLVEFLLREIADDEALALKSSKTDLSRWAHYLLWARFSPARVLAECAAKKALVELYQVASTHDDSSLGVATLRVVIRELAQPYADRPGFDPAWKVET